MEGHGYLGPGQDLAVEGQGYLGPGQDLAVEGHGDSGDARRVVRRIGQRVDV